MNKAELKKILKPLIKECIRESLFEEGVLSGIVTEVAKGMSSVNMVTEAQHSQAREREEAERYEKEELLERDRQMRIKRLNEFYQGRSFTFKKYYRSRLWIWVLFSHHFRINWYSFNGSCSVEQCSYGYNISSLWRSQRHTV